MHTFFQFIKTHRQVLSLGLFLLLCATFVSSFISNDNDDTEAVANPLPTVTLTSADSLSTTGSFTVIGTVVPADEGVITSRSTGQVVRVNQTLGSAVLAGAVIAELETSQQQSALRQAQAGLAQAQAGIPSAAANTATRVVAIREAEQAIDSAKNQARNAITTAYGTTQRIINQDIDQFYSNPRQGIPGLRIGSGGLVQTLNAERVAYREIMSTWEAKVETLSNADINQLFSELDTSISYVSRTISWLDTLIGVLANEQSNEIYTTEVIRSLQTQLAQSRGSLISQRSSLEGSRSGLQSSLEARERATIANIDTDITRAEADVIQAQARVDSAQTDLNNRLVRSPVSGTINELNITIGDFISAGTNIGRVANNQLVEIEVFISPRERTGLSIGDQVTINNIHPGIITDIAPTIDTQSRKQKVIIGLTDDTNLTINDTARITFSLQTTQTNDSSASIFIPITALQFTETAGSVLAVDDENILYAIPVEIGRILNDRVEIVGGLGTATEFVLDARGKRVGTEVTISSQ